MGFFYPNGLTSKSGAHRLLTKPIYTSLRVIFIDSVNGNDAWDGTYNRPKATLSAASAASNRLIVAKTGHSETFTSALTLNPFVLVGETSTAGVPDAALALNAASANMFTVGAGDDGVLFANMRFPVQSQSNSQTRLYYDRDHIEFLDCVFEDNSLDAGTYTAELYGSSYFEGCTIKAAGTSTATVPGSFLYIGTNTRMSGCTVDGGEYGHSGIERINLHGAGRASLEGMSLLRGVACGQGGWSGYVSVATSTEGSDVTNSSDPSVYVGGISRSAEYGLPSDPWVVTRDPVLYVDSATGDAGNDGLTRGRPFATLYQAVSAGGPDTVIVLMEGHRESLTSTFSLSDGTVVIGESDVEVSLDNDTSGIDVRFACEIRNIKFVAGVALGASSFILTVTNDDAAIVGCEFVCSANIGAAAVNFTSSAQGCMLKGCTFTATGTSATSRPNSAIRFATGGYLVLDGVTVDGGAYGFDTYAIDNSSGASALLKARDVTLKNNVDVFIHSSSTGFFQVEADPSCSVEAF